MDTETTEVVENKDDSPKQPPKFNIPRQIDYNSGMEFTPLNGGQILREVITDTYVTASQNEDEMVEKIDDVLSALRPMTKGFAGYFSFCYLQLTLFYTLGDYDKCDAVVKKILHGVDCVERYIFTRSYDNLDGTKGEFVNYAFGESDEELPNTVRYLHDAWNVAKLIHAKSGSFESGYSLVVAELMLHAYNKQLGMMRKDCEILRELAGRITKFIQNERENPSDGDISVPVGANFIDMGELHS